MKSDPVNVLVLILVASFAIDRIVSGLLFLMSFNKAWTRRFPDPALIEEGVKRTRAENKQKLIYFTLAGVLGIGLLSGFGNIRILAALGVQPKPETVVVAPGTSIAPPATQPAPSSPAAQPSQGSSAFALLDIFLTGLILMGGADRISAIMKEHGAPGGERSARPIEITGKLVLEDVAGKKEL